MCGTGDVLRPFAGRRSRSCGDCFGHVATALVLRIPKSAHRICTPRSTGSVCMNRVRAKPPVLGRRGTRLWQYLKLSKYTVLRSRRRFHPDFALRCLPCCPRQVMLTGATMYALAIGAVSHIITTVVARHSHSRRIERHAEAFIRMHSLPQYLASEVRIIRIVPAWMMVLASGSGEGPCCVCFLPPPPRVAVVSGQAVPPCIAVHCCAVRTRGFVVVHPRCPFVHGSATSTWHGSRLCLFVALVHLLLCFLTLAN